LRKAKRHKKLLFGIRLLSTKFLTNLTNLIGKAQQIIIFSPLPYSCLGKKELNSIKSIALKQHPGLVRFSFFFKSCIVLVLLPITSIFIQTIQRLRERGKEAGERLGFRPSF
jgi:hypothetical protein